MSTVDDTAGEQMPLQATSSAQFQGETYQILVSMKEIEASLAELRRVHAEHGSPDDPELMTQTEDLEKELRELKERSKQMAQKARREIRLNLSETIQATTSRNASTPRATTPERRMKYNAPPPASPRAAPGDGRDATDGAAVDVEQQNSSSAEAVDFSSFSRDSLLAKVKELETRLDAKMSGKALNDEHNLRSTTIWLLLSTGLAIGGNVAAALAAWSLVDGLGNIVSGKFWVPMICVFFLLIAPINLLALGIGIRKSIFTKCPGACSRIFAYLILGIQFLVTATCFCISMLVWLTFGVCESAPSAMAATLAIVNGPNVTSTVAVKMAMKGWTASIDMALSDLFQPVPYKAFANADLLASVCDDSGAALVDMKSAAILLCAGATVTLFAQIQMYGGMVMLDDER